VGGNIIGTDNESTSRAKGLRLAGLVLRAPRPADAKALTELVNLPGFRFGTLRLPFQTPEEVRTWIGRASFGLVAVMEDKIVGQARLRRYVGRQSHVASLGIGVHDNWVRRGIGTALLEALLDTADRWLGIRRLELTVYVDNTHAINLYRRFGFEMEGTHRAYALRDGEYVDAHTMARLAGKDPLSTSRTSDPLVVQKTLNFEPAGSVVGNKMCSASRNGN
jgi:putative acetyltransferase